MAAKIDLRLGDCIELLKGIEDKSIDLIVTDPPYDVAVSGGGGTINTVKKMNVSLQELSRDNIADGYDFEKVNNEFIRVMKDINIYVWCNKAQIYDYMKFYIGKYNCKFEILSWHKNNALPTYHGKYLTDTEYCLYFHSGKGKTFPTNYEDAKTYFINPINAVDKKYYAHPTIKPLGMIEKLVRNSSEEGDTVLDTFMGSGTTGVACKKLNRNFIGFEINEEYFNIASERINNEGMKASLF